MQQIGPELYEFSSYIPEIDLSFNQFLLATDEPVLIHTGTIQQTKALLPELEKVLGSRELAYIFFAHFEADECGGLALLTEKYPQVKVVCSEVSARQLSGFGFKHNVVVKKPGEKLVTNSFELEFISYPSEMHLWKGLFALENRRGVFFSSDIMIRFGKPERAVVESDWSWEISNIQPHQIPDPEKLEELQTALGKVKPTLVATGHGPCLSV